MSTTKTTGSSTFLTIVCLIAVLLFLAIIGGFFYWWWTHVSTATPTGKPYEGPAINIPAHEYTGNSCIRADGTIGREGKRGGQLGCWKQ